MNESSLVVCIADLSCQAVSAAPCGIRFFCAAAGVISAFMSYAVAGVISAVRFLTIKLSLDIRIVTDESTPKVFRTAEAPIAIGY
jgi:hypothetical protein